MNWSQQLIEDLAKQPCCGYASTDSFATEPTALAALALASAGHVEPCREAAAWLKSIQAPDGSVGVRQNEPRPAWTTSLAVLVWLALRNAGENFDGPIDRAVHWILHDQGETIQREESSGHDSMLVAWSWVPGTHAWVEPTALHVLALKRAGMGTHPRTRSAIQMLRDRQLPRGGWNYGNTFVLEQELRAHVQPTALALLALAGETDDGGGIRQSLSYLRQFVSGETSTTSLAWSVLAMAAHGELLDPADRWLEKAYMRLARYARSPLKLALLALAAQKQNTLIRGFEKV